MKSARKMCLVLVALVAVLSLVGCGKGKGAVPEPPKQGPLAWVDRLRVGEPAGHANLVVYPVLAETPAIGAEYLTLEEGIKGKLVRVTEVGQHETPQQAKMTVPEIEAQLASPKPTEPPDVQGDVNQLLVHNHGDKALFILAGQTVCGGKQDRICPEDVVIAPHTSNYELKVFCVEQGRWHVDSDATADFELAQIAVDDVRKTAQAEKDQGKVWRSASVVTAQTAESVGYNPEAGSGTGAYLEAASDPKLKAQVTPYVDALSGKWKSEKKLAGFVVVVDGRIRSVDVFNDPVTFAKLRDKLLESYAARAVLAKAAPEKKTAEGGAKPPEPPGPVTKPDVEKFLKTAYARRDELSSTGCFSETYIGGACLFGSAGGDLKRPDNGVQHIYMSVDEKKDAKDKPKNTEPVPAERSR